MPADLPAFFDPRLSVLPGARPRPYIHAMQHLDLSDHGDVALGQDVRAIVENDRYPLSPRIRTLRCYAPASTSRQKAPGMKNHELRAELIHWLLASRHSR